ncbi:MAG: hypothetical protein AAGD33_18995 [Actinomycetota bacterium]
MTAATTTRNDPRLRWAVGLAVLLHGALLASGSFRDTYDAWVHIFFGDHYARDWFSTWEPRWYTGFTVASYPPATHQGIGMLSGLVGLQWAFVLIMLSAIANLVVGVYRFSLLWVSRTAAGWAAVFAAVSSSLAEVVHTFGQLPTTFALGFLLHAQPSIFRWIRDGGRSELASAIALLAATTAGHHVTTLFGSVFFTGPVAVRALLDRWRVPLPGEPAGHGSEFHRDLLLPSAARRLRRILRPITRVVGLGALAVATLIIVVLPYWLWSSSDPIVQVPIPHASRHDFLDDRAAGLVFWVVPWLGILILVPVALARATFGRGWPLAASTGLLALLGTGGTTPIPRAVLGGAFDILTLDRFTIWATIAILPFVGWAVESLRSGGLGRLVTAALGNVGRPLALSFVMLSALGGCVFSATLTAHRPFQPAAIDPDPIVSFLEKDDHDRWRYLTLGFGDQMAWIAANTTAATVDGNYHSARRLPELTTRSVERLEGAKYRGVPGIGSLQQFLTNPSTYHLKFVFSVDRFYDPLLWATGWRRIGTLPDEVEVWERADVPPLPDVLPVAEIPDWQRAMWGVLPLTSVGAGMTTLAWFAIGRPLPRRFRRFERPARRVAGPLRPVDRRLARTADRLRDDPRLVADRVPWEPLVAAASRARSIAAPIGVAVVRGTAVLVIVAGAAVGGRAFVDGRSATPAERITEYYDALDFQRFTSAHAILDPDARPDLADYLLEVSLRDGLLAGYAELDSVTSDVTISGDTAAADVELVYVTAVTEYAVEVRHELVRRGPDWFLLPDAPPSPSSTGTISTRADVEAVLPIAFVGGDSSSISRLLDRPIVDLGSVRTVRHGERWIVVGSVTNRDADTADLTVSATLRSPEGQVLARYDAGQSTIKRVLPGETVAFRIDVEGRAGSVDRNDPAAGDFDPMAYSAPVIDDEVASVQVAARAVVAGGRVSPTVHVDAATIDPARGTIEATVRNDASTSATVARITATYLDAAGDVVWVDHHWVPAAITPRSTATTEWTLADPEVEFSEHPLRLTDSREGDDSAGLIAVAGLIDIRPAAIEIGGEAIVAVRLDVTSFEREVPL